MKKILFIFITSIVSLTLASINIDTKTDTELAEVFNSYDQYEENINSNLKNQLNKFKKSFVDHKKNRRNRRLIDNGRPTLYPTPIPPSEEPTFIPSSPTQIPTLNVHILADDDNSIDVIKAKIFERLGGKVNKYSRPLISLEEESMSPSEEPMDDDGDDGDDGDDSDDGDDDNDDNDDDDDGNDDDGDDDNDDNDNDDDSNTWFHLMLYYERKGYH